MSVLRIVSENGKRTCSSPASKTSFRFIVDGLVLFPSFLRSAEHKQVWALHSLNETFYNSNRKGENGWK